MSYTKAILQLIQDQPDICEEEIVAVLQLDGRDVTGMIWPYIERGHVIVNKEPVSDGRRKIKRTFAPSPNLSSAIQNAARGYERWGPGDVEILTNLYPHNPNAAIARCLGRTAQQIENKARKLGLRKAIGYIPPEGYRFGPRVLWSVEELTILKQQYPDSTIATLSAVLGKTSSQILVMARKLGLKKSAAFWKSVGERIAPLGIENRITAHPVGTEKIWSGYVYIKVDDTEGWVSKHRLAWRAHHGDYNPKTHSIWFIDRNPLNCDISNLELITKVEHADRSSGIRYPEELRSVINLYNKLRKVINEQH
ncbi:MULTISPECIES: HNH endonuclease signature motif containing protein [Burkholderia]|uniref:HNH endonuclease signature motif containing protein n=1 Tax=Burkholderia TaxID=32008 RepID=UPI0009C11BD3|nr:MULTISPECIES: HNH endonuclease signature motif containing protein [Burkholderia]MCA8104772.1 HNH endonuclease [Burkholderia sp. AU36459]